jgi:hypothetical protein
MTTQVKLHVPGGWCPNARDHLIETCERFKLPFVDRDSVCDRTLLKAGIEIINYKKNKNLPKNYVFFSHFGMDDLPHNITLSRAS